MRKSSLVSRTACRRFRSRCSQRVVCQLAQRNRLGPVRVKVDENAHARARQVTGIPVPGLRGLVQKEGTGQKVANIRTALSEVTRTTVNRTVRRRRRHLRRFRLLT